MLGAFLAFFPWRIPILVGRLSQNAKEGLWHEAQEILPSKDSRASKNSCLPRAIFCCNIEESVPEFLGGSVEESWSFKESLLQEKNPNTRTTKPRDLIMFFKRSFVFKIKIRLFLEGFAHLPKHNTSTHGDIETVLCSVLRDFDHLKR